MTFIRPEDIDFTKLQALSPQVNEADHEKQAKYLQIINDSFGSIASQSKTLKKLKNVLSNIKTKATADASHPTNKKIASSAENLLQKIKQAEKGKTVIQRAAHIGSAKSAQARIQEVLNAPENLKENIQKLQNKLQKFKVTQVEVEKEIMKSIRLDTYMAIKKIAPLQVKIDGLCKKIETSKNAIQALTKETHESIDFQKIRELQTQQKSDEEELKDYKIEQQDLQEKQLALKQKELPLLEKKLASIEKEIEKINQELPILANTKLPIVLMTYTSMNPVAVQKKEGAAVKRQEGGLDAIAGSVCEQFHFPEAISPSIQATLKGPISVAQKREPHLPPTRLEGSHALIVQPLVERGISAEVLVEHPKLAAAIIARLDAKDFQKKTIMQGLLAAWDLHKSNAMALPIPHIEYLKCEEKSWEYLAKNGKWKIVQNFSELVNLYLSGTINSKTSVRNNAQDTTGYPVESDASLQKALEVKWQLALFDNDRVLGFGRPASTGNHNHFQIFNDKINLPTRSFLLGLAQSKEPLHEDVKEWLLEECQGEALAEKERAGSEGHHALWRNFSPKTAEDLRTHISGLTYTNEMRAGGSKEQLLRKLPQELAKQIFKDLQSHKKTHLTESDLLKLPPFPKKYMSLDVKMERQLSEALDEVVEEIRNKLDPHCDLGNFPQELQQLKEYIKVYSEGGEIRPQCGELISNCIKALYQSDGFKKLPDDIKEQYKELFDGPEGILKDAAEADYILLLEKGLFPALDPSEQRALIERADNAACYVKRCEENLAKLTGLEDAPAIWDQTAYSKKCTLLDTGLQCLKNTPMSSIIKTELVKEFTVQCDSVKNTLQGDLQNGTLEETTLKKLEDFATDLKKVLSPTCYGLYAEMFPYFDLLIDLLTQTEDIKQRFDSLVTDLTKPNTLAAIKKFLNAKRAKDTQKGLTAEVQKTDKATQSIDKILSFIKITDPIHSSTKWTLDSTGKWNDTQVKELSKMLDICKEAIQNSNQSPKKKQQNIDEITGVLDEIEKAGKVTITSDHQNGMISYLKMLITDVYTDDLLKIRDLSKDLRDSILPTSAINLLIKNIPQNNLRALRDTILLETEQLKTDSGKFGYAFVPCDAILEDALKLGLFPKGGQDPTYQKLHDEISKTTEI
ncbi:MAG: hypothetical protein JWO53_606 [Chlamydiia bacterium]|nr:hypothetical protein [Chlamydiia bacterium]